MKRPHVLLIFRTRFEECTAMLKGIAHFERTHELWTTYHDDQAVSETSLQWLRGKKWHGVISRHTTPGLARTCAQLRVPLVDLNDVDPLPGIPKIRPDNTRIGHLGAEHFIERGYRNFGFAGFANECWSRERRDGFAEAVRLAGHRCELFDVDFPGGTTPFWVETQTKRLAVWLKRLPKPVGIMACIDLRAQQLIQAANASGILVPEEIAILGTNNDTVRCELCVPALSSVAPNAFQSGYRAAGVLADLIAGRKADPLEQRVEPLGVVTRHSTDILAVEDPNVAAALSFIRENACGGIAVADVVRHAHISRSFMERRFRRMVGRSPHAEIRRVQVRKIKQLLADTDFPLKRIAELTGFEHPEFMSVTFKTATGLPPGEYRKKVVDRARVAAIVP